MAKIFTGAKAKLLLGEELVGWVSSITVNEENTLTDVDIIGQLEVGDLAETGHKVSATINVFKPVDSSGNLASIFAKNTPLSSLTGNGVTDQSLKDMRNQKDFKLQIQNTAATDNPKTAEVDESLSTYIYTIEKCKYEGGSGTVDARGVWTGTWNIKGIRGSGL
ncbi:MAG: hypothetical protein DRN81_03215 [Thermoproteota archaeon]|nr:MAG: hypothetical protein DRN81_03215 [Candidatus Korarchaeota archaeon]